jgi:serine/threonine-protein kinase
MATTVTDLVQQLSSGPLLNAERRQELARLQASFGDVRDLARELVQRGWLTPYQVNQLVQGRGHDLVLGPYVLLERLGEGGMGTVFKAQHTFLNRPVAVKLISQAQLGSGGAAERFLMEMQLVAHLDHPHIVRAFDAGQHGDRYFLVMELIEGQTLARLVQQRGPLRTTWACACIRQAALGLQHASANGLVHRDIKPSNLMLSTPRDGAPVVKLLDLGLARPQRSESARDLTRTGTLMGTVDYLPPEQALDPRAVDVRADIYSLGCTFFFLLTGRAPFQGVTDAQILLQHQQQEPPAIEAQRPDVPAPVAAVLRRMLAKRAEQRFATAVEVAAALAPFASWDDWDSAPAASGSAAAGLGAGPSLIGGGLASPERGWTLAVGQTLARPQTPTTTTPGTAPVSTSDASYGIPLSTLTPPAPAPSLVAGRAEAPEKGWTLLTEPAPASGSLPGLQSSTAAPARAPGRFNRSTLVLVAGAAAALLLLVGFFLVRGLFQDPTPPVDPSGRLARKDDTKDRTPEKKQPQEKKELDKKEANKKEPDKIGPNPKEPAVFPLRQVVIKPGQRMTIPRPSDAVPPAFPLYPTGYIALPDRERHTFTVWDLTTMKPVHRFEATSQMEQPLMLSLDGRWLAGRVGDGVRVCSADGRVRTLELPKGRTHWLWLAGQDRLVILRENDSAPGRAVVVWDLKALKQTASLPLPDGVDTKYATVTPDGRTLIVPQGQQLLVQELRDGVDATVRLLPSAATALALPCLGLAFSPDGRELAMLYNDPLKGPRLVLWNWKKKTEAVLFRYPGGSYTQEFFYAGPPLDWLPDQTGLLVYGQALFDCRTGKARGKFALDLLHNRQIARTLNGQYALLCDRNEVRIVSLPAAKDE